MKGHFPIKVYVSGPIKGHEDYIDKFKTACEEVEEWAMPVNPLEIDPCPQVAGVCMHQGEMLETGHTWECYMRYDIIALVQCDGIYMMKGWSTSKGAAFELHIAQTLNMELYFQSDEGLDQ